MGGTISSTTILWILLALMAAAVWLARRSRELRRQSGLPDGDVIYTDAGAWFPNRDVLHSRTLRLAGKPDYLVRQHDGSLIPVELKSGLAPNEPHEGHVLQLAAYCLLVHENYGLRPDYGVLQYRDQAYAVEYSEELEEDLLDLLAEMRRAAAGGGVERDHNDWRKCNRCGVRRFCQQRLA
jgi:CRISPR-associated exonuclease Cas4